MTGVAAAVTSHIASRLCPHQAAKGWNEQEKCVVRWGPSGQSPSALAGASSETCTAAAWARLGL